MLGEAIEGLKRAKDTQALQVGDTRPQTKISSLSADTLEASTKAAKTSFTFNRGSNFEEFSGTISFEHQDEDITLCFEDTSSTSKGKRNLTIYGSQGIEQPLLTVKAYDPNKLESSNLSQTITAMRSSLEQYEALHQGVKQ